MQRRGVKLGDARYGGQLEGAEEDRQKEGPKGRGLSWSSLRGQFPKVGQGKP